MENRNEFQYTSLNCVYILRIHASFHGLLPRCWSSKNLKSVMLDCYDFAGSANTGRAATCYSAKSANPLRQGYAGQEAAFLAFVAGACSGEVGRYEARAARRRIALRGWGITTRAPRRLSNRHWLGQLCAPAPSGAGRSLSTLVHHSDCTCSASLHQLSCP